MMVYSRKKALVPALNLKKILVLLQGLRLSYFICDFGRYNIPSIQRLLTHSPLQTVIRSVCKVENFLLWRLRWLVIYTHIFIVSSLGFFIPHLWSCCLGYLLHFGEYTLLHLCLLHSVCLIHRVVNIAEAAWVQFRCTQCIPLER